MLPISCSQEIIIYFIPVGLPAGSGQMQDDKAQPRLRTKDEMPKHNTTRRKHYIWNLSIIKIYELIIRRGRLRQTPPNTKGINNLRTPGYKPTQCFNRNKKVNGETYK